MFSVDDNDDDDDDVDEDDFGDHNRNGHRCNHPYPYCYSAVCNLLSCYYINVMSIRVCELKLRA